MRTVHKRRCLLAGGGALGQLLLLLLQWLLSAAGTSHAPNGRVLPDWRGRDSSVHDRADVQVEREVTHQRTTLRVMCLASRCCLLLLLLLGRLLLLLLLLGLRLVVDDAREWHRARRILERRAFRVLLLLLLPLLLLHVHGRLGRVVVGHRAVLILHVRVVGVGGGRGAEVEIAKHELLEPKGDRIAQRRIGRGGGGGCGRDTGPAACRCELLLLLWLVEATAVILVGRGRLELVRIARHTHVGEETGAEVRVVVQAQVRLAHDAVLGCFAHFGSHQHSYHSRVCLLYSYGVMLCYDDVRYSYSHLT